MAAFHDELQGTHGRMAEVKLEAPCAGGRRRP
jgi:hypothetical protein